MSGTLLQPALHRAQIVLDGLLAGAVVLDRFGHAWQRGGGHLFNGSVPYWYRAYGDSAEVSSYELCQCGPFKVLEAGQ